MPSRRLRQRLIQGEAREDDLDAKARAAGYAAAEEIADDAECIPGEYERGNLHFTEYAASRAADDFADEHPDRRAEEVFFGAFVEALSDLRPDLRVCGEEDEPRSLGFGRGARPGAGLALHSEYEPVEYTFTRAERERVIVPGGGPGLDGLGEEEGVTDAPARRRRSSTTSACFTPGERDRYAIQVCASRTGPPLGAVGSSRDVARVFGDFIGRGSLGLQEHFAVMLLDSRHKVLGIRLVSIGTATFAPVSIADALRPALILPAAAVIVCHNHPSNDPTPSSDDIALTKRLSESCTLLGLRLLDHVIIAVDEGRYVSFVDAGLLRA